MHKPAIETTQAHYAICIGINGYTEAALSTLQCAENDARGMYNLFLQWGFLQDHCYLLLGEQATVAAIEAALTTFLLTRAKKNDLVIFYFAGHGIPIYPPDDDGDDDDPVSDVFLATCDADCTMLGDNRGAWLNYALRLGNLRDKFFERTRSKKVLFLLDSCHSGDFFGPKYRAAPFSAQRT